MEIIRVECENCKSESQIREEKLMFKEEKSLEEAYCPECEKKIYEGQTDGWYYVEKVLSAIKKDEECKYPMP